MDSLPGSLTSSSFASDACGLCGEGNTDTVWFLEHPIHTRCRDEEGVLFATEPLHKLWVSLSRDTKLIHVAIENLKANCCGSPITILRTEGSGELQERAKKAANEVLDFLAAYYD